MRWIRRALDVLDRFVDMLETGAPLEKFWHDHPVEDFADHKSDALAFLLDGNSELPKVRRRFPWVGVIVSSVTLLTLTGATVTVASTAFDEPSGRPVPPGQLGAIGNAHVDSSSTPPPGSTLASVLDLTSASSAPVPASPLLADAPPLRSHEVFGFAPYWTLGQSAGFDVQGYTTIAYFSLTVNPDGTLDKSDAGWTGYQSQALSTLITRAHAAGTRVVLSVNCFSQSALNQLTSSKSAPATLSTALVGAIEAKNFDGVNLDFEGAGSGDQEGLTRLVTTVSGALHAVNAHWQLTMDTYASSAGDPQGFYDISALSHAVDGFFVMAYQLNLAASGGTSSKLTVSTFSNEKTATQYAAAVPPDKVILGLAAFGQDWPTAGGTLEDSATGPPSVITYGQELQSGHSIQWDPVTQTGWTAYEIGSQWHEAFFEDPTSLYQAARLAQQDNLAGVGLWALGFEGNSPPMTEALDGHAPPTKVASPSSVSSPPTTGSVGAASGPSTTAGKGSALPSRFPPVTTPPSTTLGAPPIASTNLPPTTAPPTTVPTRPTATLST